MLASIGRIERSINYLRPLAFKTSMADNLYFWTLSQPQQNIHYYTHLQDKSPDPELNPTKNRGHHASFRIARNAAAPGCPRDEPYKCTSREFECIEFLSFQTKILETFTIRFSSYFFLFLLSSFSKDLKVKYLRHL